jgi:hypothetical protein
MNSFWNNLYDDVKDQRYGTLFVAALFIGTPLFVLGLCLANETYADLSNALTQYPDIGIFQLVCLVLPGLALIAMALFWRRWNRTGRKDRWNRIKYSALSRDELLKARSKLKGQMKPVKFKRLERSGNPAALRTPDTNLKY